MTGDDFLETLQADVVAILKAVPSLADVTIIPEDDGDMEAKITRKLGTLTESGSGKIGCVAVVMLPEITEAEANLPGPPVEVLVKVQVIEQHTINRGATGSGVRSSEGALRVLNALHHQGLAYAALYADKKPVEPVEVKKGFLSHMVTLNVRYGALIGPGKPAQVMAEWSEGSSALTLTGITNPADSDPLVLQQIADVNGYNAWENADGWNIQWNVPEWAVFKLGSYSAISGPSTAESPTEIIVWDVTQGAGQPTITGGGGSSSLTLTCATSGSSIRYTTDGTYPSPSKTLYTAPITGLQAGTIVRAAAYKTGLNPGDCTEIEIS